MTEVKNSQNLNKRITEYYLGKLSLFDMGIVYLDEQLYSAAASYFMAASRKATTDIEKANCLTYCAYSYYMQLEEDSSNWQRDTVEELCKHALIKDRDNYMTVMILISLYDRINTKQALYYREYALKYCNIPNVYEKALLYKECIETGKKYNKIENSEFFTNMVKFIESNIRMIPKQLLCVLYKLMYVDTGSEYAIKRYIDISESDVVSLVEPTLKKIKNKTYCEITTSDDPMTLSKIYEDNGYVGATLSQISIRNWEKIRKTQNLGLDKWTIEFNEYFKNFKNNEGIGGVLILENMEGFVENIEKVSFENNVFDYAIVKYELQESLEKTDFFKFYKKVEQIKERQLYLNYTLYERN